MRKNKKHLSFYKKYAETGILPNGIFLGVSTPCGLCKLASMGQLDPNLLYRFDPTEKDDDWLQWEGKDLTYWGSDSSEAKQGIFTPLRQTIVLFMAAMKGEL